MTGLILGAALLHAGTVQVGAEGPGESETQAKGKAPWGVRLRWFYAGSEPPLGVGIRMIPWGMSGSEVEDMLGEKKAFGGWKGRQVWPLGEAGGGRGWWADLGGDNPRDHGTTLLFIDGQFYAYSVEVPPARFDAIGAALTQSLGPPSASTSTTVQNRMGAEFDQEERAWDFEDVEVRLRKRAERVTTGQLVVMYKPLAEGVATESAKAPF